MKDCLSCTHAAPATDPSGKIDFSKKVCVEGPPTPIPVSGPNGPAIMAFFPVVGKGVLCSRHAPLAQALDS